MASRSRRWLVLILISASLATALRLGFDWPAVKRVSLEERFQAPSSGHWFGADELGRDVFARTVTALGYSAALVVLALAGALLVGLSMGAVAGLLDRRWISRVSDMAINVVWSLPGLILFIALTTYFGRHFLVIVVAMAAVSWVPIARVVSLELARERRAIYVTALRALGYGELQVFSVILANVRSPVLVVTLSVAIDLVAAESGLSFLGLGIQPPDPSLGSMIYSGMYYVASGWWMATFPLVALVVAMLLLRWLMAVASTASVSRS